MAKEKKADPLKLVLEGIIKRAGKGTAQLLSEGADSDVDEVVPTGIDVLDHHVIGIGGWPVGRIVELFAGYGDGKSSLLFQSIAGVQRMGGIAFLDETEHALDSTRAIVFGADIDRCILSQSDTMEEALAMVEHVLDSLPRTEKGDPPNFIGWDSLAATPTEAEVKDGIDAKAAVGDRARIMSRAMRILTPKVAEKRTVLMVVNQTRQKVGAWGGGRTTPGGDALKFHASLRLELFSGKSVKDGDDHVGKQVTAMMSKTKVGGRPWAKAKVRLYYDSGWNNVWSTVWHAKDRGVVPKDARYTEEVYERALAALGWPRGFAAGGAEVSGEVEDADADLIGESGE